MMKKKSLLWMSVLLLIGGTLCAFRCENIDETDSILGYWQSTQVIDCGTWGYYFQADGTIKRWSIYVNGESSDYSETDWGIFWYEHPAEFPNSTGIIIKESDIDPNPDELYYAIESLTESRLVIRVYGGLAGTPYENGTSLEYKKLPGKPKIK